MKNIVIGTAGHIDHGKTSLVKKLTGINTDVLPEEIKKGITINIGFSYIDNPRGGKIGIIDVPGHEKFIKNMVAGANGIQYLLMVIACDDGIMQQTIEHFNICKFLGIKYGAIVLTKSDLCDGERVEEVKDEVREFFKGSFLENSEIFETSFKDEKGYENLKNHILEQVNKINFTAEEDKNFRMSVDRVFGVKGFGAVVTGTSQNNRVAVGDSVMIYPQKIKTKVKSIENHGKSLEVLEAGNRCALNLSGVELSEISRGDILSKNFDLASSRRIDCYLQLLKTCKNLKNNSQVRLNIGTKEILAKVKIFGTNKLESGESAFIQLELKDDFVGLKNDLGILRSISPVNTLGGVRVVNPLGEVTKRNDDEYLRKLEILSNGDLGEQIILYLKEKRGTLVNYTELLDHFNFLNNFQKNTSILENKDIIIIENDNEKFYTYAGYIEDSKRNIQNYFEEFYKNNPLKMYLSKAELKNKYFKNIKGKDFNIYLEYFQKNSFVEIQEDKVALNNYKVTLTKEQKKLKDDILMRYKEFGLNPEKTKLVSSGFLKKKEFDSMIYYLIDKKLLVFLGDDTIILSGFYREAEKRLKEYFIDNKELRLKDFRTNLDTNRRMALLILEKFDSLKITQKIDDYRILRSGQ